MTTSKKRAKNKNCKAVNSKDKCLVYERVHSNPKAAAAHQKALKKRGAKVSRSKKSNSNIVLKYSFNKNQKK